MDIAERVACKTFVGMSSWLLAVVCGLSVIAVPSSRSMPAPHVAVKPGGSAIWVYVITVLPGVPEPLRPDDWREVPLSLLVVPSGVWIGISRICEQTFFPNRSDGTYDWSAVEASLRSHKASAYIDCTVEIAARPGASYQALIRAMSAVNIAGFDIDVTDETGLRSRFCEDAYDVSAGCRSYPFEQLLQRARMERGISTP